MEQFITYPVELEMVNYPAVKEIRSVFQEFGLSVVTYRFLMDDMGTFYHDSVNIRKNKKVLQKKFAEG